MKKFACMIILVLAFSVNCFAWDIGTYPREQEMQNIVYHWFMDYALNIAPTDTPERVKFASDVIAGAINCNTLSVACATNATIRAKIMASDDSYKIALEYVIATEYESGGGVPLFTILANQLYGPRP